MGRAPCCDKANVKKGPWSPEEDAKLKAYIEQHGTGGNWIALPQKIGLKRCGKSCRLRWLNYLRPNIKHGGFSEEEDNIICSLYISMGSRWSIIAAQLPGRTDNDIKNYWNTRLKKKLLGKQRKELQAHRLICLKQEMKKGNGNPMVVDNNTQHPYWPEPPMPISMPYPSEDPHLNDHTSIRKLLIKLGGKFDDDHHHPHEPNDIASTQQLFYDNSINFLSSSSESMKSLNNPYYPQLLNNQCDDDVASMRMLQGLNGTFPIELDQMVYSNPQKVEGLEYSYGVDIANGSTCPISEEGTTSSWDNMSYFAYPTIPSNYEDVQQEMLQEECAFEGSSYLGLQ